MEFMRRHMRSGYCFCGSGKTYKECCRRSKTDKFKTEAIKKARIIYEKAGKLVPSSFYEIYEENLNGQCLKNGCRNKAIKSHLVSKSLMKTALNWDFGRTPQPNGKGGTEFKLEGIKSITTLPIWCESHDSGLFKEIDGKKFDITQKNICLMTLRAMGNETRKKQNNIRLFSAMAQFHEERGEHLGDDQKYRVIGAYNGFVDLIGRYRQLEEEIEGNNYSGVRYLHRMFDCMPIFVSSSFQLSIDHEGNRINDLMDLGTDISPILLNVFGMNGNTHVVISVLSRDHSRYEGFLSTLSKSSQESLANVLNNLIHYFCENIVIPKEFEIPRGYKFLYPNEFDLETIDYFAKSKIQYIS